MMNILRVGGSFGGLGVFQPLRPFIAARDYATQAMMKDAQIPVGPGTGESLPVEARQRVAAEADLLPRDRYDEPFLNSEQQQNSTMCEHQHGEEPRSEFKETWVVIKKQSQNLSSAVKGSTEEELQGMRRGGVSKDGQREDSIDSQVWS